MGLFKVSINELARLGGGRLQLGSLVTPGVDPETALKPLFAQLDLGTQNFQSALEHYRNSFLSVHMLSTLLGRTPFEAFITLLENEDCNLRCWVGRPSIDEATQWLRNRPLEIVIDLTAIVTLFQLEKLDILQSWPVKFIVAQSTVEELQQAVQDSRPNPRKMGAFVPVGRTYYAVETTVEDSQNRHAALSNLLTIVRTCCTICGGRQLAAVSSEQRQTLLKFFGQHGADSLVLARERNCLLWTDDLLVGLFGTDAWGVRRIWTQLAIQTNIVGTTAADSIVESVSRLIGWGYSSTIFNLPIINYAGKITGWCASAKPLKQIIEAFSDESRELIHCVAVASSLIVSIENQDIVDPSAQSTYRIILERLRHRPNGAKAVQEMVSRLPGLIRQRVQLGKALSLRAPR